ncbi:D-alanyl-D-alanine carboxypeptidase family protein [Calothrix sp. PCC 6303]|uniref:M15 family metallopeptidase n=1 Tax=Calothrix sp. PCC 6303 TaxID=1170562 RepID=UPI0002A0544B|nr:D-alanyl-D-alanine carboxypeptidase family protein [Calothrix sp. PCC 6303]AFZ00046.1 D-Ala-D-Ala carboxypeptidase [Calothrix sp. PCC 6303]
MSNAGFSGKPKKSSPNSGDDIPAALRDTPDVAPKTSIRLPILILGGTVGFIVLATLSGFLFFANDSRRASVAPKNKASQEAPPATSTVAEPSPSDPDTDQAKVNGSLLGHLPYTEAPESELAAISSDGRYRMINSAAQQFLAMQQAARSAGVKLVPISAFRSIKEQETLFFGIAAQRNQTPAERASLSAPPGYSEHHTGYAVDIGDGAVPSTNLNSNFERTKAYQWLVENSPKFYFEMSFPKDNPQGVSYEPWHWRFVGDTRSLEMFYKARNLKPVQK